MTPQTAQAVTVNDLIDRGNAARREFSFLEAEQHYRDALLLAESALPRVEPPYSRAHLVVAEVLTKLGRLQESRGEVEASEASYRRALAIFSQTTGDEYFDLAIARDHIDVPQTVFVPRAA